MQSGYYDNHSLSPSNSKSLVISDEYVPHFPKDGLFIGTLYGPKKEFPALVDLCEKPSTCVLFNSAESRIIANRFIERLVWRISVSVPPTLCTITLFNGGISGTAFTSHLMLNDLLFSDPSSKVYYDATVKDFEHKLDEIYGSILNRMSVISSFNKSNLVELNESLGIDAKVKYEFIFLVDFPHNIGTDTIIKLDRIIKAGAKAGIFVFMSWDMAAKFEEDRYSSVSINPQSIMQGMMIIFPNEGHFVFRNSGHDEIYNRFLFELDDLPIDGMQAGELSEYIEKQIHALTKSKNEKKCILKQDFGALYNYPYQPVSSEISVTIGQDISNKHPVTLKFNSGDFIHAFILGQSGSGKSVLLNNIISSAILKYSPEDLVLYLMDFKGVEFNRYRGVKHTKAVLVDNSDPQMTLEVLRELNEENKRRVKLWRQEGVTKIDEYNKLHPESRLPQVLFVADECQVMFMMPHTGGVQMQIHQEINEILNTIATQGRSQGIHMLLATQQLDEADISGQILKNLTECILLMSSPSDSNRLVPDSSDMTSRQATGLACYYHKKELQSQVQTYYADDEELKNSISRSQEKAKDVNGNGQAYFCGSSVFKLSEPELILLNSSSTHNPIAMVGKNIGLHNSITTINLVEDYSENILFFGSNKQDQTINVMMNALISLMVSYKNKGIMCDFLVIDCLSKTESRYKTLLSNFEEIGLCHIIERSRSGKTFNSLAKDIYNGCATPVVLAIIGEERFIEMKRNLVLDENNDEPEVVSGIEVLGFSNPFDNGIPSGHMDKMTFQQALNYILDEGPMQGVHVLLQVDKPGNILFEGDYGVNATDKFRHKIILKSENKFLGPMRFSKDIDVESISDQEEHLRAYYYPEGDDPVLFTPFILPDDNIVKLINN